MPELTREQHDLRRNRIGSSQIAALVGAHPYQTRMDVWLAARGESRFPGNEQTRIGQALEGPIAQMAADKLSLHIEPCTRTLLIGDYGIATPDYWIADPRATAIGILEIKNVGSTMAHAWADGPPEYVVCQVQWQMLAADSDYAWVAALLGGRELGAWRVARDERLIARLQDAAQAFHRDHILPGVPPIDGGRSTTEWLDAQWSGADDSPAAGSDETDAMVLAALDLRRAAAQLNRELDVIKNKLRQAIGAHSSLSSTHGVVSWRRGKARTVTDWEGLATELGHAVPDRFLNLLSKYTRTQPGVRSLRLPRE